VTGMRRAAGSAGPWILAVALLAVDVVTATRHLAGDYHSVLDIVTVAALVWPMIRHYGGPRLRPGQRIVSDDEYDHMETTAWRAVEVADRRVRESGPAPSRPRLRVAGDR
jgi:hypothetical protein